MASEGDIRLSSDGQDAVFFDVFGTFVVYFPESWAVPLSALSLCVLVIASARKLFCAEGLKSLLSVVMALMLAFVLSIACGWGIARALVVLGILPKPYVPHGSLIALVYLFVPMVVLWWLVRRIVRENARPTVWAVYWLGFSLVGLAIAWWLPGFSYVVLIPALGAALLSLLPVGSEARLVLSTLLAAAFLIPMANLLPIVMGPRAGIMLCPAFMLILSVLSPFLAAKQAERPAAG